MIDGVRILKGNVAIESAKVIPLRRIPDERGTIFQMLKCTDPHFIHFGEIYFSTVYPGVVKVVLYDDREESPTKGTLMEVFIGRDNYSLVVIPPDVWNGFKGLSAPFAIVANCCTHPHDPCLTTRMNPFDNHIPYNWTVVHR
jgi:dTDP-4-dehydrorhamnose 3,5-epimerase